MGYSKVAGLFVAAATAVTMAGCKTASASCEHETQCTIELKGENAQTSFDMGAVESVIGLNSAVAGGEASFYMADEMTCTEGQTLTAEWGSITCTLVGEDELHLTITN